MPAPAPTAAPPNFYDNLPAGGETAAGATGSKKAEENDADGEIMKGLTGVYRVLGKMGKLKDDDKIFKAGIDELKEKLKKLVVQGLKKDPGMLESGDDSAAASSSAAPAPAAGGAPPSQTDETHQA